MMELLLACNILLLKRILIEAWISYIVSSQLKSRGYEITRGSCVG